MKKFYTLAALACAALTASAQAIDIDNLTDSQIEGKYRVVSTMTAKIADIYVEESPLVIFSKTAENTFNVDEFILPVQDYDYNPICIGATWEPATDEDAGNLNVQRDVNGEAYFFNTYSENDDTYWMYLWNVNFRLLPSLTEEGTLQFGRAEGANPIVFQYYDSNTGEWPDAFGWYNGFTLVKEPVYTTVTKRSLPGEYVLTGWDYEGNEVAWPITIAQDGTNYTLSGLFGQDDIVLTCTWDNNNGGIRAKSTMEYDGLGYAVAGVGSYAPSESIYFSFTEDGNLVLDYDLYALIGGEFLFFSGDVMRKGTIEGVQSAAASSSLVHSYSYLLDGRKVPRAPKGQISICTGKKVVR